MPNFKNIQKLLNNIYLFEYFLLMSTQLKVVHFLCRLKKLDLQPKLKEWPRTLISKDWDSKTMAMPIKYHMEWLDK